MYCHERDKKTERRGRGRKKEGKKKLITNKTRKETKNKKKSKACSQVSLPLKMKSILWREPMSVYLAIMHPYTLTHTTLCTRMNTNTLPRWPADTLTATQTRTRNMQAG